MRHSAAIAIVILLFHATIADGQRVRFPQTPPVTGIPNTGVPPGFQNPGFRNPGLVPGQPGMIPGQPGFIPGQPGAVPGQPGAVLGNPNLANPNLQYDPFAPRPGAPLIQPGQPGPYPQPGAFPYGPPPGQPQGIFGSNPMQSPYFRSSQDFLNNFERGRYLRVVQEFHYRHTWLEGSTANEVDIHDAEIGFTLNWPNFLGSGEPIQISPTFIFHFWDGPQPPSMADLPSRAYSTFVASSWTTPTSRNFGAEIVTSSGLYTDFRTITSRSWRFKGTGLGWVRFTPNMLFKLGVSYVNRLDSKILPVGGLYWRPSDRVELELYFPNPKLKYSLPQLGNTELTAYLTADYGGDSWTVARTAGFSDQMDLVDFRVLGGIEFVGFRGLRGFFEGGYAFERKLLYRLTPVQNTKLSDSVIVRAGFLF